MRPDAPRIHPIVFDFPRSDTLAISFRAPEGFAADAATIQPLATVIHKIFFGLFSIFQNFDGICSESKRPRECA